MNRKFSIVMFYVLSVLSILNFIAGFAYGALNEEYAKGAFYMAFAIYLLIQSYDTKDQI